MKKTVLITGASSGIGYELAKLFAKDGHDLVLVARREEKLQEIAQELSSNGIKIQVIKKDLVELKAGEELLATLKSKKSQIDILINNAGFGLHGKFLETDLEAEKKMIELNITALTVLSKLFAKEMVVRGNGKIVNIASTASFQPGPFMAVYYATKAYVLSFTEALAEELRGTGVTCIAICPGATRTEFQDRAGIGSIPLFDRPTVMTAAEVARIGYEGIWKDKVVVITGFRNKLGAFLVRLTPRWLVRKVVRRIQE